MHLRRRRLIATTAAGLALPRFAIAQGDNRPTVTIAVQKIANSNTLDSLREQSNVGTRMMAMFVERLIDLNFQGKLEPRPGLATEWRRIDDRTVEFSLRRGVKMHNGDEFTKMDSTTATYAMKRQFDVDVSWTKEEVEGLTPALVKDDLLAKVKAAYQKKEAQVGRDMMRYLERMLMLDRKSTRLNSSHRT